MSRLIDADKLIERMKEDTSEAKKSLSQDNYVDKEVWQRVIEIIESYIEIINEQPTAYDVDKVVAQMKKTSFYVELTDGYSWDGVCVELKKAIEIVGAGGIDDRNI